MTAVHLWRLKWRVRRRQWDLTPSALARWWVVVIAVVALEAVISFQAARWLGIGRGGLLRLGQSLLLGHAAFVFFRWAPWRSDLRFHEAVSLAPVSVRTIFGLEFAAAQVDLLFVGGALLFPVFAGGLVAAGRFNSHVIVLWLVALIAISSVVAGLTIAFGRLGGAEGARRINEMLGTTLLIGASLYANATLHRGSSALAVLAHGETSRFSTLVEKVDATALTRAVFVCNTIGLTMLVARGLPFPESWLGGTKRRVGLSRVLPGWKRRCGSSGVHVTLVATWLRLHSRSGGLWLGLAAGLVVPVVALSSAPAFEARRSLPVFAVLLAAFASQSIVRRARREPEFVQCIATAPLSDVTLCSTETAATALVPALIALAAAIILLPLGQPTLALLTAIGSTANAMLWSAVAVTERGDPFARGVEAFVVFMLKYALAAVATLFTIGGVYLAAESGRKPLFSITSVLISAAIAAVAWAVSRHPRHPMQWAPNPR